jgi:hypothetical protein
MLHAVLEGEDGMAKAGRKLKLAPELVQAISTHIRDGAFDWVAAQAAGIGTTTYYRWLEWGARRGARRVYREFREAILTARAEARVQAEMRVYQEDRATWLLRGPGRERPGQPGWAASAGVTMHHNPAEPL